MVPNSADAADSDLPAGQICCARTHSRAFHPGQAHRGRPASPLLEASAEDFDVAEGRIFVAGTDRALSFREFAEAVYSELGRLPSDAGEELDVTKVYARISA